jgi:putative ATPase
MADPNAIQVVMSCAQAFEQVGMPEGRFHLALAALYLATAKKSNSTFAFFDALGTVEKEADSGVPNHLRDASRDSEGFGHGEGYLYPHAYRDHWVAQQYLPASLQGKVFYQPSDQGYEAQIRTEVARRREAQLAAMLEVEDEHIEMLTFSPDDPARERWLQRTLSNAGERLGQVRDRVLDAARLARHAVVLDLKASTGLLTWEALRRVPEGGVYALARTQRDAEALRQMAERLSPTERPMVMQGRIEELPIFLRLAAGSAALGTQGAVLQFDAVVGYNVLLDEENKAAVFHLLADLLAPGGVISLADRVPRYTQRLYQLVDAHSLPADLMERWQQAEEAIYAQAADPLVNWDVDNIVAAAQQAALAVAVQLEDETTTLQVTPGILTRWFTPSREGRPSYVDHLNRSLTPDEIAIVRSLFERQCAGQAVPWGGKIAYVVCRAA